MIPGVQDFVQLIIDVIWGGADSPKGAAPYWLQLAIEIAVVAVTIAVALAIVWLWNFVHG